MNERIRQLADEAKMSTYLLAYGLEFNISIEKFAELIVRECARIGELKEQGYEDYDPDLSVGWYMKHHFGVES
jgi:hypothetical protein